MTPFALSLQQGPKAHPDTLPRGDRDAKPVTQGSASRELPQPLGSGQGTSEEAAACRPRPLALLTLKVPGGCPLRPLPQILFGNKNQNQTNPPPLRRDASI